MSCFKVKSQLKTHSLDSFLAFLDVNSFPISFDGVSASMIQQSKDIYLPGLFKIWLIEVRGFKTQWMDPTARGEVNVSFICKKLQSIRSGDILKAGLIPPIEKCSKRKC